MGMCTPEGFRDQQDRLQTVANAALAAQYRACGQEPPDFCKPQFIEAEFEVVDEQKLIASDQQ